MKELCARTSFATTILGAGLVALALAVSPVKADTILNFDPCPSSGTPTSACITSAGWSSIYAESTTPPSFGDNVSANLDPNGYGYYGGAANTPNVTVDFDVQSFLGWGYWGGAEDGLSFGADTGHGYVTLVADPGYQVTLDSFDYNVAGAQTYNLEVISGGPSSTDILDNYSGSTTGNEAYVFSPDVTGSEITIFFNNWNTGLDNIDFSQSVAGVSSVPEPSSVAMLCTGLVGLLGLRRKFRGRRRNESSAR
jgi:hypothetical protein